MALPVGFVGRNQASSSVLRSSSTSPSFPLLPPRLCAEKIGSAWFLLRLLLSKSLPRTLRPRSSASSPASTTVTTSGSPERRSAGGAVPNHLAAFLSSLIFPCEQPSPLWALIRRRLHHRIHLAASFSLTILLQLLRRASRPSHLSSYTCYSEPPASVLSAILFAVCGAIRLLLLDEADTLLLCRGGLHTKLDRPLNTMAHGSPAR